MSYKRFFGLRVRRMLLLALLAMCFGLVVIVVTALLGSSAQGVAASMADVPGVGPYLAGLAHAGEATYVRRTYYPSVMSVPQILASTFPKILAPRGRDFR